MTRRRNRDAEQQAQARIYISIARLVRRSPCIGVERVSLSCANSTKTRSAPLPRPCEDPSSTATCSLLRPKIDITLSIVMSSHSPSPPVDTANAHRTIC